jgi:hypothetical protein
VPILPGTINAGAGFDILLNVEKLLSKPDKVTKLMQLSETLVFEDGQVM